jgi:hypothetical protein
MSALASKKLGGSARSHFERRIGGGRMDGVATKLRCHCLCKVEMSISGTAGSVSRRRGDHHIGAVPAWAGFFRVRFGDLGHSQDTVLQETGPLA